MAFNPDEYLASKKKSTFDPDAYLAANKPQPSMLESGLRGAAQGASLGFSDELTGALESTAGSLGLVPDKTYEQSRNEARAANLAAQQANPITYGAGEVGGGLASSLALPGAAATMGGRALQAGATGAIMGYGTADKREDILPAMATGAALGSIATPLIEGGAGLISRGASKVASGLSSGAEKLALNATGATGREAQNFAPEAGRELLDRGLVGAFNTPENIATKIGQQTEKSGNQILDVLKTLDDQGVKIDTNDIITTLQNKVNKLTKDPSQAEVVSKLKGVIENISGTGESQVSASAAEQTKRGYNKMAGNWMNPEVGAAGKETYGVYKTAVEKAAEKVSPELSSQFETAKKTYGLLSPIQDAAERRAAITAQSPFGGLLDTAAGLYGLSDPDSLSGKAALAIAGRRVLGPRIASTAAVFTDQVAKVLQHNPQALGKYARTLGDALARGPAALASTNFLLQQTDPEYRKLIHGDTNGQ